MDATIVAAYVVKLLSMLYQMLWLLLFKATGTQSCCCGCCQRQKTLWAAVKNAADVPTFKKRWCWLLL